MCDKDRQGGGRRDKKGNLTKFPCLSTYGNRNAQQLRGDGRVLLLESSLKLVNGGVIRGVIRLYDNGAVALHHHHHRFFEHASNLKRIGFPDYKWLLRGPRC